MSQYYKHELARWEGEGGSHRELMPPSHDGLHSNNDFILGTRAPSGIIARLLHHEEYRVTCGDTDPKRAVLFGGND